MGDGTKSCRSDNKYNDKKMSLDESKLSLVFLAFDIPASSREKRYLSSTIVNTT